MAITSQKFAARKRKVRLRLAFLVVFFLIALTVSLVLILRTQYFLIKSIEVTGATLTPADEVKQVAEQVQNNPIAWLIPRATPLWYPKDRVVAEITKQWKRVSDVEIHRSGWGAVSIALTERKPAALFCASAPSTDSPETCSFLDNEGFLYAEAPQFSDSVYVVFREKNTAIATTTTTTIGTPLMPPDQFVALLSFVQDLEHFELSPVEVLITDADYEITLKQGTLLYVTKTQDLGVTADHLKVSLSEGALANKNGVLAPLAYIDLRFHNKVYYKTASPAHATSTR